MEKGSRNRESGFSLVEMLVATVVGAILMTAIYQLLNNNRSRTDFIQNKADFRDRATLATTSLNRSITMAGFGMTRINAIKAGRGQLTDTLTVYTNQAEERTTLRDSANANSMELVVFKGTGFVAGGMLGITDSLNQEYAVIASISGDSSTGFRLQLAGGLLNAYSPGVPDVYPVQKEVIHIDDTDSSLVRHAGGRRTVLAESITGFRVDMRDAAGNTTNISRNVRVVTFSLTGTFKAPSGAPNLMHFSSTVIPRNLL